MFNGLADYMRERNLNWHPNLRMISDWEQVYLIDYTYKILP